MSVTTADLRDEIVAAINDSGEPYGNAILRLDQAKRKARENDTDVLAALKEILGQK